VSVGYRWNQIAPTIAPSFSDTEECQTGGHVTSEEQPKREPPRRAPSTKAHPGPHSKYPTAFKRKLATMSPETRELAEGWFHEMKQHDWVRAEWFEQAERIEAARAAWKTNRKDASGMARALGFTRGVKDRGRQYDWRALAKSYLFLTTPMKLEKTSPFYGKHPMSAVQAIRHLKTQHRVASDQAMRDGLKRERTRRKAAGEPIYTLPGPASLRRSTTLGGK